MTLDHVLILKDLRDNFPSVDIYFKKCLSGVEIYYKLVINSDVKNKKIVNDYLVSIYGNPVIRTFE